MIARNRLVLSVSGLVIAGASLFAGYTAIGTAAPSGADTLTILYTGQAYGQIRSCNCTKFRHGGYGRQATLVEKLRKENPNIVLIEGGDALVQARNQQDELKTGVALNALDQIGYDARVLGEIELQIASSQIEEWQSKYKTPLVLANARYPDGKPVCKHPFIVKKAPNGLRVAVIGVMGPSLISTSAKLRVTAQVSDSEASVKGLLPQVRPKADYIVVVAHAGKDEARAIAGLPGVNMVICTHSADRLAMPAADKNILEGTTETIGDCTLVMTGSRSGWSVGRLDLEFDGKKPKSVKNRTFFLDRAYDEHPGIVKLYDDYNAKVAKLSQDQQNAIKEQFAELMKARGIDPSKRPQPKIYAGTASCKTCHEEAYAKWEKSRHAHASATLEKTGQEADPECINCHNTGARRRGGFVSVKETPELAGVHCEACHGGGTSHAAKPAAGYGAVSEVLCRSCHTDEFNPDFDFGQMTKLIDH